MKKFSLKMKKNCHRNSSEKNLKRLFIWLCVVILLLFIARGFISSISSFITTPFFSIAHYIETSSATVPVFIRSREELLTQIRELEQEISSRQGISNTLSMVVEENKSFRRLLNASSSSRIAAGVIARPPHIPYDVVLIDKGSEDGILEDVPVYYEKGKILGYVSKVFSGHSLVTLFSSPAVETSVYVFGPNIFAIAYGQGGGVIKLNAPQGLILKEGDLVIAPSIDGGILGSIESVESNPSEPEQRAFLTYDIPVQSIRIVSVGTKPVRTISFKEAQQAVFDAEDAFLRFVVPEEILVESYTEASSTVNELEQELP